MFEDLGQGSENLNIGEVGRTFFGDDADVPESHHFVLV